MDRQRANAQRFRGDLARYDRARPAPPDLMLSLLPRLAGVRRPRLVVDLGSGTGLSTRVWSAHATRVVGIEPSADMLAVARDRPHAKNVRFEQRFAHDTGLADGSVDIATSMQALHWMEPRATWREMARIVRPGGIVAAIHAELPPLIDPRLDAPFREVMRRAGTLASKTKSAKAQRRWTRDEHLAALKRLLPGAFVGFSQLQCHGVDEGDAARFLDLVTTLGDVAGALQAGATRKSLGLDVLARLSARTMDRRAVPWVWSYEVLVVRAAG